MLNEYRCKDSEDYTGFIMLAVFFPIVFFPLCGYLLIMSISAGDTLLVVFLSLFLLGSLYCEIVTIKSIKDTRTGIFVINSETATLTSRIQGKDVFIQRSINDIQRIVLKCAGRCLYIVLVDSIGKFGIGMSSSNGEYIKLKYSKEKLENIKRFLPHCPVIRSDNISYKEL